MNNGERTIKNTVNVSDEQVHLIVLQRKQFIETSHPNEPIRWSELTSSCCSLSMRIHKLYDIKSDVIFARALYEWCEMCCCLYWACWRCYLPAKFVNNVLKWRTTSVARVRRTRQSLSLTRTLRVGWMGVKLLLLCSGVVWWGYSVAV